MGDEAQERAEDLDDGRTDEKLADALERMAERPHLRLEGSLRLAAQRLQAHQRRLDALTAVVRDEVRWHDVLISWDPEDGFWLSTVEKGRCRARAIEVSSPHRNLGAAIDAAAEALDLRVQPSEDLRFTERDLKRAFVEGFEARASRLHSYVWQEWEERRDKIVRGGKGPATEADVSQQSRALVYAFADAVGADDRMTAAWLDHPALEALFRHIARLESDPPPPPEDKDPGVEVGPS